MDVLFRALISHLQSDLFKNGISVTVKNIIIRKEILEFKGMFVFLVLTKLKY